MTSAEPHDGTGDTGHDGTAGHAVPEYMERGGVPRGRVASWEPMSGGGYNTLYRVTDTDGRALVLKVPPRPDLPCLGYERDLLVGEAAYYRALAGGSVPVPSVVGLGVHEPAGDRAFLLMSERPGRSWNTPADTVDPAERARLREALGRLLARAHTVRGPGFGYPAEPFAPLAAGWRQAFTGMTEELLCDAERFAAWLPRPLDGIRRLMAAAAPALEEVAVPVAVHFDLWEGNILLDGAPGHRAIGGIVDAERMFWGDPLADLPSLSLFGAAEDDPHLMAGYRAAGGVVPTGDAARARLALYRCYLYLIMLVETVPRGYSPVELRRTRLLAGPALVRALETLAALAEGHR
jgi:aminoglycoside phosphotransferase (APT) family kinase protein